MSNCDVCIGGGDAGCDVRFYQRSAPVARKDYRCLECSVSIPIGTKYQRAHYLTEGSWHCDRSCLECAEIRSVYSCNSYEPVGELWEAMHDYAFDSFRMAGECWDSLSAPAKEKLLEQWRKWKGIV